MSEKNIIELLKDGDRRSIGRSDEAVAVVSNNRRLFPRLILGLRSENALIRMRASDAAEKVTRKHPEWLAPFKKELLGLLRETKEQEVRWHLAVMIPRLRLNSTEREVAFSLLKGYLQDRSSIVKTFALQGLADLALEDGSVRSKVIETLRQAMRNGTPAMKARSRKLLPQLDDGYSHHE